ncbi:MAG: dinitrogenase iron-molybdenum cofactor biosynthesis protein [Candidatus Odinarchaeota archaeon]|nr:dinitrogenase iron-molybdenum cofactor biosynthesis protein [Candidatus Odinarchaeota archaeon]
MAVERIAFATQGAGGINDIVSPIFGRCPTYTIVEIDNGQIINTKVIQNYAGGAIRGAGIQAAQIIASEGVTTVVAGSFGPNASMALGSMGIRMIPGISGITVKEAVDRYIRGELTGTAPVMPAPPAPMAPYPTGYPGMPYATQPTKEQEIQFLMQQKEAIEKRIKEIEKRIAELEKQK